jgi:Zn-dependent protease with chaperone function
MKFLNLIFIFCSGILLAQNYVPLDTLDRLNREIEANSFMISAGNFINSIKGNYPKKIEKLIAKNYEEFNKEFEKKIKEGNFIYDSRFSSYVNTIFNRLKEGNPNLPQNLHFLISKDPSLNAYCLPNGTFVLNLGLFYWLDNDDEFASVLAHELSHNMLKHSLKIEEKRVSDHLSSNTKTQIKSIKKQKYNKSSAALDLFKTKLYASGEMRKNNEYQADSLGFLILKNSPFNEMLFIDALKLMIEYDSIKPSGVKEDIYRKVFNLPNQPFNENWFKSEDFSNYDYSLYQEKINKDSISTHPEIEDRIKKLKKNFAFIKDNSLKTEPSKELIELQMIAHYEQIPSMYFFEEYGTGIYLSLIQLQKNSKDSYYREWMGKCFEKIYEGRKNYILNRYLRRVDPENQSKSYQQFLNFMWNLSLEEIKNISDYYNKKTSI